ncbi:MAG: winged helix-turn-helix transcriptional regulator [Deltaproteobacteria bacterium]|jgi:DNA-binding transcriptional ArsR family regulator|nr:winged helix-turn-helix transcriptional regulator [Deltaproteobacteria bacterium]
MQPSLDTTFTALADPTRRAILARLAKGEATVNELTAPFEISQPAISRHLKVLEQAGLISRRIDGTSRPCRLSPSAPRAFGEINAFLALLEKGMAKSYERLDQLLAQMSSPGRKDKKHP